MRGLYAIVDTDALARRGIAPVAFAEAVLDARPAALQVRDKHGAARETLALLRNVAPLARRAGVPLFANDRPDLAALARCDGVHVGQEDAPVAVARKVSQASGCTLRVGLSTHARAQVEAALLEPIDYLAIGPIFATHNKEQPDTVVGLEALAALRALVAQQRSKLPIVAIGGITLGSAARVGALCGCAAAIGALLPEQGGLEEVRARALALHTALLRSSDNTPNAAAPEARRTP